MHPNTPDLERPIFWMGSVAFLAGLVIAIASALIHPTSEDLMDNSVIFAVYAEDDLWVASHIGQFAGIMLIFAGGFVRQLPKTSMIQYRSCHVRGYKDKAESL